MLAGSDSAPCACTAPCVTQAHRQLKESALPSGRPRRGRRGHSMAGHGVHQRDRGSSAVKLGYAWRCRGRVSRMAYTCAGQGLRRVTRWPRCGGGEVRAQVGGQCPCGRRCSRGAATCSGTQRFAPSAPPLIALHPGRKGVAAGMVAARWRGTVTGLQIHVLRAMRPAAHRALPAPMPRITRRLFTPRNPSDCADASDMFHAARWCLLPSPPSTAAAMAEQL